MFSIPLPIKSGLRIEKLLRFPCKGPSKLTLIVNNHSMCGTNITKRN
jgi:hypothetical protein